MENQKPACLRRSSDTDLLRLTENNTQYEFELRDVTSEDLSIQLVIDSLFGINFSELLMENNSISANGSSYGLNLEGVYEEEPNDFERNIEHYVIVSKYGLSTKTKCFCGSDKAIPSSSSCTELSKREESTGKRIHRVESCFELRKYSEDIDFICMKHVNDVRTLRPYKEACHIYEMFIRQPTTDEAFADAEFLFQMNYPYFWEHICETYNIFPDPEQIAKERDCKVNIIQSCKCLLQEENIQRIHGKKNSDLLKTKLKFGGKNKDLQKDFETACNYMRKEYPFLFTTLIRKYKVSKCVADKLNIEKNRRGVISLTGFPHEVLSQRDDQYSVDHEWLESCEENDEDTSSPSDSIE
ncbi:hypothetical protein HHI36_023604 [Cryptolaemus montrouzieri]|uniref:Uncharacterized protein n=1 Tax=Cryptolaemus montrouzieri TaxID=559131 RepID=A0ABD2PGX3_9CUCU